MAGLNLEREAARTNASATSIGSKFSGFQPEQEVSSRKAEVIESKSVAWFREMWEGFKPRQLFHNSLNLCTYRYEDALQAVGNRSLSPEQVRELCIALAEFQEDKDFGKKAGYLLSALINTGKAKRYEIVTKHLSEKIVCLGFRNTKRIVIDGNGFDGIGREMLKGEIVVKGDAGDGIGCDMKGGRLIVLGDAGNDVGTSMKRGLIRVHGSVGQAAGHMMKGGKIIIEGDTGLRLGDKMVGGLIRVGGDIASRYMVPKRGPQDYFYDGLGQIGGGRIYLKGKQLVGLLDLKC